MLSGGAFMKLNCAAYYSRFTPAFLAIAPQRSTSLRMKLRSSSRLSPSGPRF